MTPPPISAVIETARRTAIRYSINRWDFLRWQFYQLIRNRVLIAFVVAGSLGMIWKDYRTAEMAAHSLGFKIFYGLFFIVVTLCAVGVLTMALTACTVVFKKFQGLLGNHELEISDQGLIERTDVNETVHRWAGFHKIVRTGRYLYIFVTDHNIHIVPRRHFASEQEHRAFQDEIQRRIDSVSGS